MLAIRQKDDDSYIFSAIHIPICHVLVVSDNWTLEDQGLDCQLVQFGRETRASAAERQG
jgi:hypothetical protein